MEVPGDGSGPPKKVDRPPLQREPNGSRSKATNWGGEGKGRRCPLGGGGQGF